MLLIHYPNKIMCHSQSMKLYYKYSERSGDNFIHSAFKKKYNNSAKQLFKRINGAIDLVSERTKLVL